MQQLVLTFVDGTQEAYFVDRLDRDELDTALDDIAAGSGTVLITDTGPVCIPATSDLRVAAIHGTTGDAWLSERIDPEEGLDGH